LKFRFEIIILLFIAISVVILQVPYIFEFPGHIHGWAQADRLALANGFIRNGFDLFHPETQVFNHIYPHDFSVQASSTITAVDCPLHDYTVAFLMKLLGIHSPVVFRFYVLFMSVLGLVFLGKLSLMILKDEIKALFVVFFAALSPVFVYYQGTLLPSIPSLSFVIMGVFFYLRFREMKHDRDFHVATSCLGIALIARTTFVIPFVAMLALELLDFVKSRKWSSTRLVSVLLVMGFFLLSRVQNQFLTDEYGSMFLNHLMPPDSLDQAISLLNHIWTHWRFTYFSSIHYWAVLIIGVVLCINHFFKPSGQRVDKWMAYFVGIYFFGCSLFAGAMLKQFQDHDYYFLDTFYLPCILLLILLLAYAPAANRPDRKWLYGSLIVIFIGSSFRMPQRSQRSRHEWSENDRLQMSILDYQGSDLFLDEIDVPPNATILVMDAMSPNTALTMMNRKGLVVMNTERHVMENAFRWNFDYVVFQNDYLNGKFKVDYPEMLTKLSLVATNGKISVFRMLE